MMTTMGSPLVSLRHSFDNRLGDIRIPGRYVSRRCPYLGPDGFGDRKSSAKFSRIRSMSFFLIPMKRDDPRFGITEYPLESRLRTKSRKAVQLRERSFGFHDNPDHTTFWGSTAIPSPRRLKNYDSTCRKITHKKTGRPIFFT